MLFLLTALYLVSVVKSNPEFIDIESEEAKLNICVNTKDVQMLQFNGRGWSYDVESCSITVEFDWDLRAYIPGFLEEDVALNYNMFTLTSVRYNNPESGKFSHYLINHHASGDTIQFNGIIFLGSNNHNIRRLTWYSRLDPHDYDLDQLQLGRILKFKFVELDNQLYVIIQDNYFNLVAIEFDFDSKIWLKPSIFRSTYY